MKPFSRELDPQQIAAWSPSLAQIMALEVVHETGSTNSDLLARCRTLAMPTMLVAEVQSAGRGRAGRSWLSEPGSALTFSLAWPFQHAPQGLLGLPLAMGVVLAQSLLQLHVNVQVKWPNDILKNGKKLAGVLVETTTQGELTWAVVGIGLNLRMPAELESQIGHLVADAAWLAQMDRNQLLAILLDQLALGLQRFDQAGLAPFVDAWNSLHAHKGQRVNILDQGKTVHAGIALGVNHQGCLLVQDDLGVVNPIMVGDVSLRIE